MIYPSATDILRTIDANIVDKIAPSLTDLAGRSALATVRHLLRHVMVRIDAEGQVLSDDIAALRPLLADVRKYLHALDTTESNACAMSIEATLREAQRDATKFPNLAILSTEAAMLRESLYQSLAFLQSIRSLHREEQPYTDLRAAIRGYLVNQIEQEGKLIAPAFYGNGPRR